MSREEALKIMNDAEKVFQAIDDHNKNHPDHKITEGFIQINDLDEVANALQLTIRYFYCDANKSSFPICWYNGHKYID